MKLSNIQKDIISKMRDGWELGKRDGMLRPSVPKTTYVIQKGGLGNGGEGKKMTAHTFYSLFSKKLVEVENPEQKYSWNYKYRLTELGKNIKLD